MTQPRKKILITGATGYVGGRLLESLGGQSHDIRCLSRRTKVEQSQEPGDTTHEKQLGDSESIPEPSRETVTADLLKPETLPAALRGIETAFYLVHSMGTNSDFSQQDRKAAENFVAEADRQGVKRIIYLGGLGNPDHALSAHLKSRQEIGNILRSGKASVIEFRASIIIGSGSLSFELIRSLVERLPLMICPKWVHVQAQPIAIEDVLAYLSAAIDLPCDDSQIFEIGGPDQVSYGEIMQEYAGQRNLRRWMIPVPLLTPYLSSLWLGLVTPVYARIGRKLIESLRNPTLVSNNLAERVFNIEPRGVREAIQRAIIHEDHEFAITRWSDALSSGSETKSYGGKRFGSRLIDSRTVVVPIPTRDAFVPIRRIGGKTGWYYGNWLWRLRGFMDLLVGGVGVRRGRRDPENLRAGDAVDFWRVETIEPDCLLRLQAEMKVPGRAWLEFEVSPVEENEEDADSTAPIQTVIRQTAEFDPLGLFGIVYWYSIYPFHGLIFSGMLRNIARAAEERYEQRERAASTSHVESTTVG